MNRSDETIIKSKKRVQKHGEVFTPKHIVNMMLDQPGIKEACESLTETFLEPSAGEGAFLSGILTRKLEMVQNKYNQTIKQYEHHALLALASLYGVELLEDNAECCVMVMDRIFNEYYLQAANHHQAQRREEVSRSAMYIISKNIAQGNFLTKKRPNGEDIVFNEWQVQTDLSGPEEVIVQRTEYTLQEIADGIEHLPGYVHGTPKLKESIQISLFDFLEEGEEEKMVTYRYIPCAIEAVYLEEMEEADESHAD